MKTYRIVDFYGRIMISGIPTKERAEVLREGFIRLYGTEYKVEEMGFVEQECGEIPI